MNWSRRPLVVHLITARDLTSYHLHVSSAIFCNGHMFTQQSPPLYRIISTWPCRWTPAAQPKPCWSILTQPQRRFAYSALKSWRSKSLSFMHCFWLLGKWGSSSLPTHIPSESKLSSTAGPDHTHFIFCTGRSPTLTSTFQLMARMESVFTLIREYLFLIQIPALVAFYEWFAMLTIKKDSRTWKQVQEIRCRLKKGWSNMPLRSEEFLSKK